MVGRAPTVFGPLPFRIAPGAGARVERGPKALCLIPVCLDEYRELSLFDFSLIGRPGDRVQFRAGAKVLDASLGANGDLRP